MDPIAVVIDILPWEFRDFRVKFIGWNLIDFSAKWIMGFVVCSFGNHFHRKAQVGKGLGNAGAVLLIADQFLPHIGIKMAAQ
jgi:hypothetical protein